LKKGGFQPGKSHGWDFVRLLQLQKELQTDRLPGNQSYMDRFERDGVCFRGIKYWPVTYPMLRDATLATLFDILDANFIL